jgi:hypothetical protein
LWLLVVCIRLIPVKDVNVGVINAFYSELCGRDYEDEDDDLNKLIFQSIFLCIVFEIHPVVINQLFLSLPYFPSVLDKPSLEKAIYFRNCFIMTYAVIVDSDRSRELTSIIVYHTRFHDVDGATRACLRNIIMSEIPEITSTFRLARDTLREYSLNQQALQSNRYASQDFYQSHVGEYPTHPLRNSCEGIRSATFEYFQLADIQAVHTSGDCHNLSHVDDLDHGSPLEVPPSPMSSTGNQASYSHRDESRNCRRRL